MAHQLSESVVDLIRADFQKAVRLMGVPIIYKVLETIVSFGASGISGASGTGVERDPVYSQPRVPSVSGVSGGKRYTDHSLIAIVNMTPSPSVLRNAGFDKKTDAVLTIDDLALVSSGIVPEERVDRVVIAGVEYDINDVTENSLGVGATATTKGLCWNFGLMKRMGRI